MKNFFYFKIYKEIFKLVPSKTKYLQRFIYFLFGSFLDLFTISLMFPNILKKKMIKKNYKIKLLLISKFNFNVVNRIVCLKENNLYFLLKDNKSFFYLMSSFSLFLFFFKRLNISKKKLKKFLFDYIFSIYYNKQDLLQLFFLLPFYFTRLDSFYFSIHELNFYKIIIKTELYLKNHMLTLYFTKFNILNYFFNSFLVFDIKIHCNNKISVVNYLQLLKFPLKRLL